MSSRLIALNIWLRLIGKPAISKLKDPEHARLALKKRAENFPKPPAKAYFNTSRIETSWGNMPVEWVSYGRADRKRIILYLHGGAYIMGSPETHRSMTWILSQKTGMRVMVPDYRLAPEHPFPAAILDIAEAYQYLLKTGYSSKDIAIAGDSAGGGLCFALLQYLQENNIPDPACITVFSPWVDMTFPAKSSQSLSSFANKDILLPLHRLRQVVDYYLKDHSPDHPWASPLFGKYKSIPPCLIQAGTKESLALDAHKLSEKLRMDGGDVMLEFWNMAPHNFQFYAAYVPEGMNALDKASTFIKQYIAD